jgi:aromatic ring-opening dioxygenase catalytic subunit (LigB family)
MSQLLWLIHNLLRSHFQNNQTNDWYANLKPWVETSVQPNKEKECKQKQKQKERTHSKKRKERKKKKYTKSRLNPINW